VCAVQELTSRAEKLAADPTLHREEEKHDGYNIDFIQVAFKTVFQF
jgi:hypothetical protein